MLVALFVPCLVDQFFPETGLSTARVLRHLGVEVVYPEGQTCCGQPAFNAGYRSDAAAVATCFLRAIDTEVDAVVAPSGSCVAMIRNHYADLDLDTATRERAERLAGRCYEFTAFLTDVLGKTDLGGRFAGRVAYHASCHLRRELGIDDGPRRLLAAVRDLDLVTLPPLEDESCCGFGGAFSVKFPELSTAMAERKCEALVAAGAEWVTGADVSCLMQIDGVLKRKKIPVKAVHVADLLARSLGLA